MGSVHELLDHHGIEYWLFGGWAVDFYAGSVTRPHDDVDVAVWLDDHVRIAGLFIPLRDGLTRWSGEPLGDDVAELEGVRARIVPLSELKRSKLRAREDPADAARDRADSAMLSQID